MVAFQPYGRLSGWCNLALWIYKYTSHIISVSFEGDARTEYLLGYRQTYLSLSYRLGQ